MNAKANDQYYAMRAQQELDMAAVATDVNVKVLHLNMAAQYANLREQAAAETHDARDATKN